MNASADPQQPVRLLAALYPNCERVVTSTHADYHMNKSKRPTHVEESDFMALVYIVVVLVFYSAGVMVMIVRYLKTEKKELEEEAALENFFKCMPDRKQEQEHRVNRVAIHAFHTLTSISYDEDELDDRDLLAEEKESMCKQTPPIAEETSPADLSEVVLASKDVRFLPPGVGRASIT